MKIVLDSTLQRIAPYGATLKEKMPYHADRVAKALGYNGWGSEKKMTWLGSNFDTEAERAHLGFVGLLADAYDRHEKVRVGPHDLWFIVMSQIAKIVNENSKACRPLFTTSDEKVEILVQSADVTTIDPISLMQHLSALVPTNAKLFVPDLTTADFHARVAMAAVFADAVQSYYDYFTFCCGIPEIEVTGTPEDWGTLNENSMTISELFRGVGLDKASQFMVTQAKMFAKIAAQVSEGNLDLDFWKGIFTSKNIGSGGELQIGGWITNLFYDPPSLKKLENFEFSVAAFDYSNKETGRKFKTAYGAFEQLRSPEGFMYAGYTNVIYELP